jgi:hypothetical protein
MSTPQPLPSDIKAGDIDLKCFQLERFPKCGMMRLKL